MENTKEEANFLEVGQLIECGHCNPKFAEGLANVLKSIPDYKCECQCHIREKWEKDFVKTFYVYNLIKQTPAGAEKEAIEFIKSLLSKARTEEASGCFNHAQMEVEKEKARVREEIEKLPTKCARCEDFSTDTFSECICADKRMEFIRKEDIKEILK